jgi:hypothetical protein
LVERLDVADRRRELSFQPRDLGVLPAHRPLLEIDP